MTTVDTYFDIAANRRTIYTLTNESTISDAQLEEIVKKTLLVTPSAFNTQSAHMVVLLGEQHKKLWDIVKTVVMPHVAGDKDREAATEAKLNSFQAAYASILFFEDASTYEPLMGYKIYVDKYESWREQGSGMAQLVLWTALEAAGMGVHVQHYNPLIDEEVKKTWAAAGVNPSWKLVGQMVTGKPTGDKPAPKELKPLESRYQIIA